VVQVFSTGQRCLSRVSSAAREAVRQRRLSSHQRGMIIMARGSATGPAQHRVQPTPLSRRGTQATVRAFRLCLQSERVAARLTPTLACLIAQSAALQVDDNGR
jgi:hypothetical protein